MHCLKPDQALNDEKKKFDLYYDTITLQLIENERQCQKKCCGY